MNSCFEGVAVEANAVRVWAVFHYFYPNFSGAAIQGRRLMQSLAHCGFEGHLLVAADVRARHLAGVKTSLDGLEMRYLPVIPTRSWYSVPKLNRGIQFFRFINRLLSDLSFSLQVRCMLKREGRAGDILLCFSHNETTPLALRTARQKGMHSVIRLSMMESDAPTSFTSKVRQGLTRLRSRALWKCDAVVSLSSALRQSCLQIGVPQEKVWYIPNGVDLEEFHPISTNEREQVKTRLQLPRNRRTILFVGSAKHRKGIDVLIRAFIQLADANKTTDLVLVGPHDFSDHTRHPPERRALVEELKAELAQSGLEQRVHWVGEVQDVLPYLQAADVFCFPSRREGLPTAVVEAMACGVPIVASHLAGITTDLIDHKKEGLLIQGYAPDEYAQALSFILDNPTIAQEFGRKARERVQSRFSLEAVTKQYVSLFRQLNSRD